MTTNKPFILVAMSLIGYIAFSILTCPFTHADGGVTFTNIADIPSSGLSYQRARSTTFAAMQQVREQSMIEPIPFDQVFPALGAMPYNTYGQPGIAIFDYDRDGDLDIYVTNGPDTPNSLFQNQLADSGQLTFIDVGVIAGVAATSQDSQGVSFGDTDNDGDDDLLVLGRDEPNRFFENQGNGMFSEVPNHGLEGGNLSSPSAAMGDINGDGLLDVAIANAYSHENLVACFLEAFVANQPNQLFLNQGNNTFTDVSETSGIRDVVGFAPGFDGSPTITWSVGMVDVDLDGDTDIIFGDDQCAFPQARFGGVDRGFMHVFINEGAGQFTDQPFIPEAQPSGSWMGLSFGDFNADGNLDIFGSNFGEYGDKSQNPLGPYRAHTSRWILGNGDGTFTDLALGEAASVFGWGEGHFPRANPPYLTPTLSPPRLIAYLLVHSWGGPLSTFNVGHIGERCSVSALWIPHEIFCSSCFLKDDFAFSVMR